jgi:hypothetical protein
MLNSMFPVDQCKRDEVSNYELREGKGRRKSNRKAEEPRAVQIYGRLILQVLVKNVSNVMYLRLEIFE